MLLTLSKRSSLIAQSGIRAMTLECARIGGINLAQGECDTEAPLPVRTGAQEAIDAGSKTALVDHPNYRSSHSLIAGIAGLIGFLEDIFTLSSRLRLLIQIIISALIVWLFLMMPLSMITVLLFIFWIVFITGTANLYNFMDGINGIAGFTGVVGFGLISYSGEKT